MSATKPIPKWRVWLEHDYFPDTERLLRQTVYTPLGGLCLAALAALLGGWTLHPNGFVVFAGLISLIVLGVIWPWIGLRGLSGRITFASSRIREGETVETILQVRNRLPWAAWGLVVRGGFCEKEPPGSKDGPPPAASMSITPGRKDSTLRWAFTPPLRGVYPNAPSKLCTGFPFGLRESKRSLVVTDPLLVWPKTFPVGPAPSVEGENQIEGTVSRNKVGTNGDVIGVRPYRRGDSPRRIHWSQSAKHDRLIVCELQSNARPLVQVVLDVDPEVHRGLEAHSSREWAIRVAASLVEGWVTQGVPVEVVFGNHFFPASSGTAHLHKVLDALAKLTPDVGMSLTKLLAHPGCSQFRNGVQVVITTNLALQQALLSTTDLDRRLIVLDAAAIAKVPPEQAVGISRSEVWLWLDDPERIPQQLRHSWKEALHGS